MSELLQTGAVATQGPRSGRLGGAAPPSLPEPRRDMPAAGSLRILLRLLRFSGHYTVLCLGYAVASFLIGPLLLGFATQAFFDGLAGKHASLSTWGAIAVLVAVQVADAMSGVIFRSPWSSMQQKAQALLRWNLFAGVLRGYGRHGLSHPAGEIVTRFRDDPELSADTLDAFCDLVGRTLFAAVAFIVMWRISPQVTAVLFVPLVLCSFITRALGRRIRAYRAASRVATGRMTEFLAELVAAQLAVKVAGATGRVVNRLEELGEVRRRAEVRDTVFGAILDAFDLNLGNVGAGIVLLLGAQGLRSGTFTVGDLGLFVVYLDALTWFPDEISRLIGGLQQMEVSLERMHAVAPGEAKATFAAPGALSLHGASYAAGCKEDGEPPSFSLSDTLQRLEVLGLTYAHPGEAPAVEHVSFTLEAGTLTAITGKIGAGKTTVLEILLGLRRRDAGEIRWNGRPVEDPATFFVPPRAAFVPQVPRLFSWTIRENIVLGRPADDGALSQAIETAVLEREVDDFPRGLDTLVGPRGLRLSGGQMHRVAAARALLPDPELLVFDDVSSALDAETERELWRRLFQRRGSATYLVVTHRPAVLSRADQVLVMERGRLVAGSEG